MTASTTSGPGDAPDPAPSVGPGAHRAREQDGVHATAVALMAGVSLRLGRTALIDPPAAAPAVAAVPVLWRTRLNSAWLIGAGAAAGLAGRAV